MLELSEERQAEVTRLVVEPGRQLSMRMSTNKDQQAGR